MRRAVFWILRIIIAAAALANLAALFLFEYRFPQNWHLPFGRGPEQVAETELPLALLETEAETETEEIQSSSGIRLDVPSAPVSYNGSGRLDLMSGVYVVNPDGTSARDVQVYTSISEGNSRREKIITYTANTPEGETLTATRLLNLGSRYTGPSINVLGNMPWCPEGEAESYAQKLISGKLIAADDGFGNDMTAQVTSSLKRYDASREEAAITLRVQNTFNDVYETEVQVPMNTTGIVFTLTSDRATCEYGVRFSALPYVDICVDAEGNSLIDYVVREGDVDSYTPGEYHCIVYCTDADGNRSITREMTVTVEQPPEEEENY